MTNFTLRPYQEEDVAFGLAKGSFINANEPGLGKTLETLVTVNQLAKGSILVISPKMATGVWSYEAEKWLNWDSMRITGEFQADERNARREDFDRNPARLLIINSAMIGEIQAWQLDWDYILIDEAHLLGLLNPKSVTFNQMCKFKYKHIMILTGTPVRKGPQDLWPMLHLIHPERFRNYWSFVNRYCMVIKTRFGKEILNRPKDPLTFNAMIREYMIRRKKIDVLKDLPAKIRDPFIIQMSPEQTRIHTELIEELMSEVSNDELVVTQNKLLLGLRLRQLLVCPRLIGLEEDGGAIQALSSYLIPEEFEAKRAVVVTTPFREAVPYIESAIRKSNPGVYIEIIHGKIKESAQVVAQRFQDHKDYRKVLIYTIKSGASWTAHTASSGFMLGYDWSAINNLQAEDRIHRLGQTEQVMWKYLVHENSIDISVMERLDERAMGMGWVLDTQKIYDDLKKKQNKYLHIKP